MILPMQLAASLGRVVSPISGVVIATTEIAQVPIRQLVKRNLIPITAVLITMLIYHFFI